jgi:hypothetical protein
MCDSDADYTTVVGPRGDVRWFLEFVSTFAIGPAIEAIEFDDLARLGHPYDDDEVGAVGVLRHAPWESARVASSLNAEFRGGHRHSRVSRLIAEPGQDFVAATVASGGGGGTSSLLDPQQVTRALALVPSLPRAAGRRVALLDTGDSASTNAMIDVTGGLVQTGLTSVDPHGHGTAVAEAIRSVARRADIHPIRVLGPQAVGSTAMIYQGLIVALWDAAGFDVVNASFSVTAASACSKGLASTFDHLMRLRAGHSQSSPPPTLVAAAGNNQVALQAPATALGAKVVTAVDLAGAPTPYVAGLRAGNGVTMIAAPGATKADPLGTYRNGDPIYGTSFAAGFVSGALAA